MAPKGQWACVFLFFSRNERRAWMALRLAEAGRLRGKQYHVDDSINLAKTGKIENACTSIPLYDSVYVKKQTCIYPATVWQRFRFVDLPLTFAGF